ncbi:MAG: FAD-dependent oxidoreductase [Thermomicrobiales bacterium]
MPHSVVVTVDSSPGHEANLDALRANVAMQNRLGIESQVITGDELRAMQPFVSVDDIPLVSFEPDSGCVNAIAATQSMAEAALRSRVSIYENCGVTELVVESGRIRGVETINGPVAAYISVVAIIHEQPPAGSSDSTCRYRRSACRSLFAIIQRLLTLARDHFVFIDTASGHSSPWGPGTSLARVGGAISTTRSIRTDYRQA